MFKRLREYRIVPLVSVTRVNDARNICKALTDGGLPIMEMMFRKHSDSKIIKTIVSDFPDFQVGVGGILNKDLLLRAIVAQAKFAFAPGVNPETIKEANERDFPFTPGICSPTDIEIAILNGAVNLQFFPAEPFGGLEAISLMIEPFEHLGTEVFVKGGITKDNMVGYLKHSAIAAVSASWIAPADLIQAKAWGKIKENATEAVKIVKNIR